MGNTMYGIEGINQTNDTFNGHIKFCGIGKNDSFIFMEEHKQSSNYQIIIQNGKLETYSVCDEVNASLYLVSKYDDHIYYICNNPARLTVYLHGKKLNTCAIDYSANCVPLYVTEDRYNIFVTLQPARLQIFSKKGLNLICDLDLTVHNIVEPNHVLPLDNILLITDCFSHIVIGIDKNNEKVWDYGTNGKPGKDYNQLCVPLMTTLHQGNVLISEQRTNRILFVDFRTKEIVEIWGKNNDVGYDDGLFWSPQAISLDDYIYIIMCKGSNIFIRRYCTKTETWDVYFGNPLFTRSHLNFPRGCDYSAERNLLAVADTYHDQIVLFNLDGSIYSIIDRSLIETLHWPRCVKWIGNDLYIVNSTLCEVWKSSSNFMAFEKVPLPVFLFPPEEWMQSFGCHNQVFLLAFEQQVLLWDNTASKVRWNSKELIALRDVHYAQLISEDGLLITDTGHNRGVYVDQGKISTINYVYHMGRKLYFNTPRIFFLNGKELIVVDSGNSRIIVSDFNTLDVIHIFGGQRGWGITKLSKPRWLCTGPGSQFFISDTDNHRILLADIRNN